MVERSFDTCSLGPKEFGEIQQYNISMVYQWKIWKKSVLGKPARDLGDLGALGVGVRGIRFRYVIRITQHSAKGLIWRTQNTLGPQNLDVHACFVLYVAN